MPANSWTAMVGDNAYQALPTHDVDDRCKEGDVAYQAVPPEDGNDDAAAEAEEKERVFQRKLELEAEVQRLQGVEDQIQKTLDGLNSFWQLKAEEHSNTIEDLAKQRNECEEELHGLDHAHHEDNHSTPRGPRCLYWVRGNRFTAVCSAVVVTNLITMFMELAHPHYKEKFFVLDQVVLVFYICEIILKALLFRKDLYIGGCLLVWWNWLDLLIVIVGVLDQWVQPLLPESGDIRRGMAVGDMRGRQHHHKSSMMLQAIKMLRLARLARILKTVRAFMESDLSWAEGKHFQLFIMGTIAANSLIMSFESDIPDWPGWFYVEQALLIIFSFELLVRLRHWGCRFFYHDTDFAWNWLDFVIVVGGIIDQWLMPALALIEHLMGMEPHKPGNMGEIMTTLRMARLLRILRLVRLVKNIPPLFTLIVGILQAMQGMAWVLVLTAVFLYAFALLAVRLIGHGLLFGGRAPPEISDIFPSVPETMFVLFKVMNGDTEPLEPVFEALPIMKLIVVLYMVVSSWAILSILTAVVSENMIQATEHHREEMEEEMSNTKEVNTREYLKAIFASADKDGSGELGAGEFEGMLTDAATLQKLRDSTKLEKADLKQVFDLLLLGDKVSQAVFVDGLLTESRAVTERSVFRLEKRLIDLQRAFEAHMEHIAVKEATDINKEGAKLETLLSGVSLAVGRNRTVLEKSLLKLAEKLGIHGRDMEELTHDVEKWSELDDSMKCNIPGVRAPKTFTERGPVETAVEAPPPVITDMQRSDVSAQLDAKTALNVNAQLDMKAALSKQLLPMESAVQRMERRLDSIALESNLQRIELSQRTSSRSTHRQDVGVTCEAVLAKLEAHLAKAEKPSSSGLEASAQSILMKVEMQLASMREMPVVNPVRPEPLMRKLEIQLQAHQQSANDALVASIDMSQNMTQSMRQVQSEFACLIGKYEQRLQAEMNRVMAGVQTWTTLLHHGLERTSATSRAQPRVENHTAASVASPFVFAGPPFLNIGTITEESEQVPGIKCSGSGATGGTLEE